MLGDLPAALGACAEGLGLDPDDAELHFRKAVLHRHAGQSAEAEACWRRILTLGDPTVSAASIRASRPSDLAQPHAVLAEERGDR